MILETNKVENAIACGEWTSDDEPQEGDLYQALKRRQHITCDIGYPNDCFKLNKFFVMQYVGYGNGRGVRLEGWKDYGSLKIKTSSGPLNGNPDLVLYLYALAPVEKGDDPVKICWVKSKRKRNRRNLGSPVEAPPRKLSRKTFTPQTPSPVPSPVPSPSQPLSPSSPLSQPSSPLMSRLVPDVPLSPVVVRAPLKITPLVTPRNNSASLPPCPTKPTPLVCPPSPLVVQNSPVVVRQTPIKLSSSQSPKLTHSPHLLPITKNQASLLPSQSIIIPIPSTSIPSVPSQHNIITTPPDTLPSPTIPHTPIQSEATTPEATIPSYFEEHTPASPSTPLSPLSPLPTQSPPTSEFSELLAVDAQADSSDPGIPDDPFFYCILKMISSSDVSASTTAEPTPPPMSITGRHFCNVTTKYGNPADLPPSLYPSHHSFPSCEIEPDIDLGFLGGGLLMEELFPSLLVPEL